MAGASVLLSFMHEGILAEPLSLSSSFRDLHPSHECRTLSLRAAMVGKERRGGVSARGGRRRAQISTCGARRDEVSVRRSVQGGEERGARRSGERFGLTSRRMAVGGLVLLLSADQGAGASALEDVGERSLIAALNAREILQILSAAEVRSPAELRQWLRVMAKVAESLAINLPPLVEIYDVDPETVEEILGDLGYAQSSIWKVQMPVGSNRTDDFRTEGSIANSRFDLALKLLRLSLSNMEWLLAQIPEEAVEWAQLARGIRPML